jgi:hypothetical protein
VKEPPIKVKVVTAEEKRKVAWGGLAKHNLVRDVEILEGRWKGRRMEVLNKFIQAPTQEESES